MQNPITKYLLQGDARTINAKKNIFALFFLKGINILTGFLIVPITIDYVSPETYGIWLTLSAVVIWISYFDLGLPSGFRNKFAEAKALGNHMLAKELVSTTYFILTVVFTVIFILLLFLNRLIDWSAILHLNPDLQQELHDAFIVLCLFFCIRVIASILCTLLMADQKPALSAAVQTVGQVLALAAIYVLTKTVPGSLYYLTLVLAGIPAVAMILISIYVFSLTRYRTYAPSLKSVRIGLAKSIMGQGFQFFIIYMVALVIQQFTNVAISRELDSLCVTEYNIAFKYFSVVYMGMELLVMPFWSAFTEAYTHGDFQWMRRTIQKLELMLLLLCVPAIFLMQLLAVPLIRLWIGDSVMIPLSLTCAMGVFAFFQSAACVYSNLVNGTGKIRIQLIASFGFIVLSVPFIISGLRIFGLWGCLIFPTAAYAVQALLCRVQILKIVKGTATNLWLK